MFKTKLSGRASYTLIIPLHTWAVITTILATLNILTLRPRCIIITATYINVVYLSAFETGRTENELCRVAGLVLSLVSILFIEPNGKKRRQGFANDMPPQDLKKPIIWHPEHFMFRIRAPLWFH